MAEKFGIEDEYAKEAIEYAVTVVRQDVDAEGKPLNGTRDRLAAARLILDFTKSKPTTNASITLNKAEDFLKALVAEEESGPTSG